MNKLILCFFISCPLFAIAQHDDNASIKGSLLNKNTQQPIPDATLIITKLKRLNTSDNSGNFTFHKIPYGTYSIIIQVENETIDSIQIVADKPLVDLGIIRIYTTSENTASSEQQIPSITVDNNINTNNDGISNQQNISTTLSASSHDPFLNTVSYVLSSYNFRPRGYDRSEQQLLINGITMNDLTNGSPKWALWSGLNDMFRNTNNTYGLGVSENAFGGINGALYYDISAAAQTRQTRITYSSSNRAYTNQIRCAHNSGISRKGWVYSIAATKLWAQEAYLPGTFTDAYSCFFSVSKALNSKQTLSLTAFAAPDQHAQSAAATDELFQLANNHYYNPNWGWQNGIKRNAKIAVLQQPVFLLNHEYNPDKKTKLKTAIGFQFGKSKRSSLDWYKGSDPHPDYYRNLPSYYAATHPAAANAVHAALTNNPDRLQLDWDQLYNINSSNTETLHNVNGIPGNDFSGNRSIYVLGSDVEQMRQLSLSAIVQHKASEHRTIHGGINYTQQHSEYYKTLDDLLGGDYFTNNNAFAAQQYVGNASFAQNDLNTPNRVIRKHDKYEYDFINRYHKGWAWVQGDFNYRKISCFVAGNINYTSYSREGLYRNGLFADNSYGKSNNQNFLAMAAKAGATYKINGRSYLFANTMYQQDAPGINNLFISPQTRNQTIEHPELQTTQSIEAGYLVKAPRLNIRIAGYATDIKNVTRIQRFYNDDPDYQSFVNFVLQQVNMRFIGTELAIEYAVNTSLSLSAVAAMGQAFYTNRPQVSVYSDNDTNTSPGNKEVYIKNYYLGVGPQSAYSAGIAYNGVKHWYGKINFNYLDRNYIAINPARRTIAAAELVDKNDPLYQKIFDQEKLPPVFSIDLVAGKSFRLNKVSPSIPYGLMLYIHLGIANLLNNTNQKSGGYEQLRYDFTNNNPDKFPSKYYYGYGRTFFLNIGLKL